MLISLVGFYTHHSDRGAQRPWGAGSLGPRLESCPVGTRPEAPSVGLVWLHCCLFKLRNVSAYTSNFLPSDSVANQDHNKQTTNALQMKECQESQQICFPLLRSFP